MNKREVFTQVTLKLRGAVDSPWKVTLEISRWAFYPLYRLYFILVGVKWPRGLHLFGRPIIQRHRGSRICLGRGVVLNSHKCSNPLAPNHPVVLATRTSNAQLVIGDNTGITGGTICSATSVALGSRVSIGANCVITDTDFHPLHYLDRQIDTKNGASRPVVIEDDVFIGMNVLVLKGVKIGRGSVIGAGSVVTKDIPPLSKAAGNPAKVVGQVVDEKSA